ncbi:hypothetical protein WG66_006725 [Moniliophthora roreri]|uniref:Uncharacterized protein n=1 Tax=Moniliophthora roreri TaxID=221103 RepID=A0A0W0ET60_MONRR|nr:hypothetical protein WG66_006725 [Moniliophthora roreri]
MKKTLVSSPSIMELEPLGEYAVQEEEKTLLAVLLPDAGDDTMDEFEVESYCLMSKSVTESVLSSEDDDHELDFYSFEDDGTGSFIDSSILLPATSPSPAPVITLDATTDTNKDENHPLTDHHTALERKLDTLIADIASLGLPNAHTQRLQRELDAQTRLLTTERARGVKLEVDLQEARATVSALHGLDEKLAVLLADKSELADACAVASQLTEEKRVLEAKVATLDERIRSLETDLEAAQRQNARVAEEKCSLEEKLVTTNEHTKMLEKSLDVEQMKSRGALTLAGKRDEKLREFGKRITTLGTTNNNLITEVAKLKTELHEARIGAAREEGTHLSFLKRCDEHIQGITTQLNSKSAALEVSETGLREKDSRITELNRLLGVEKTRVITRDVELNKLNAASTQDKETIQSLRHREAEQNAGVTSLRADLERARASLSQSEQAKSAIETKLGNLERKYARMKQEKEAVTRSLESERAKRQDSEERRRTADERHGQKVASLRGQITALEATRDELKTANDQQKRKISKDLLDSEFK